MSGPDSEIDVEAYKRVADAPNIKMKKEIGDALAAKEFPEATSNVNWATKDPSKRIPLKKTHHETLSREEYEKFKASKEVPGVTKPQ